MRASPESDDTHDPYCVAGFQTFFTGRISTFGDIVISVRPLTETLIQSTLYVHSDANNTEQTPDSESLIEIPLSATGINNGARRSSK